MAQIPGPRWAPQVVVLIDDETCVLNVNRTLAGSSFDSISETSQLNLHGQLHPACDGRCRFNEMWRKAWNSLKNRDSVEWEVDDPLMNRLLRLNLSKTPAPAAIERERRQRHKLLTVTDITKYRREYELLVEQQQALIRLLMAQGLNSQSSAEMPFDEAGDTGNRLMARYVTTERSLSRQLIEAQETERKRIASELHDGIAQSIGAVKYRIEDNIAGLARRYPDMDLEIFDGTLDEIKNLVGEVRRISRNLSPSILEDFGIQVALEWLCEEFNNQNSGLDINCSVSISEGETSELVKVAIYRVAQEALNNISKHSSATHVEASLEHTGEAIELIISDNGCGFETDQALRSYDGKAGLGLGSMRERVEATGGTFSLKSSPENGVVVRAKWVNSSLEPSQ